MVGHKKILLIFLFFLAVSSLPVYAHCPLCTGAIGAAAVYANYLGVNASVIGVFVGAFAISTGLWVALKIKKQYVKFQKHIIVITSFLLTVVPLMSINTDAIYLPVLISGPVGSLFNKVYFLDKMIFGSFVGSAAVLVSYWFHLYIKNRIHGVLFPYQGVVLTLSSLVIASGILYVSFG